MLSPVGGMVGPIGSQEAASSTLSDFGEGYDFAIGGMGFRLAVSDQRPYERATAQFRKDSLDTSGSPGDQSLVGYWTRSQLSFHNGAGIDYYELDGESETVLNRYSEGSGVNPFDPGEVTLFGGFENATTDTYADNLWAGSLDDQLVVLTGGDVRYGTLGTAADTYNPASSVVSVAPGGGNIYCALADNTISRIGLSQTYPVVYSTGFESGIGTWASSDAFSNYLVATLGVSAATVFEGTQSLEVTWPASGAKDKSNAIRNVTGLTAGRAYTMVANVWAQAGTGANVRPFALFHASGDPVVTEGAWTEVSFTFVASAASHFVGFENTNLAAGGEKLFVDKVVIYEGTRTGYDDGTTPVDVIYSHSLGIRELHYVKDRLLMMDEANTWHQLAPNPTGALPVAVATADKLFTATGAGNWSVVDTPGPIILGNGNRLFMVTQDNDGSFPTLISPVQVADLPNGENVIALSYYLGFLAISTTAGIRIGVIDGSGGVTYGPRLLDWDSTPSHTTIARAGTCVYVVGDHRALAVNLGFQVGNGLEFSWTDLPNPFLGTETNYGFTNVGTSVIAWTDDRVEAQTGSPTVGSLTTGLHRFGTLEPKKFQTVRVRVAGSKGTVLVSKVTESGAVVPLYTINVADSHVEDITLQTSEPSELLGLQFTLTAVDGVSPKLLGYQLRALPAPKRQRLIRVPLQLQDVERRGTTRSMGRPNSAWDRLTALETMEQNGGTFLFQDFRTGESGTCFIEQIEHQGTTPPGKQSDAFGGLVFLTIRKL